MNPYPYDVLYSHLASHMRQDENMMHDNLMQNSDRLTSKANNSHLNDLLRIIILPFSSHIVHREKVVVQLLSIPCTFQHTIEMYRAPYGADNIGARVPDSCSHSPATVLVQPVRYHTSGPVVGGWKGKHKPSFDNVSLIDNDPFQVSSRFPNLVKVKPILSL